MCFVRGPASALANVEASEISNSIHLLYKYEFPGLQQAPLQRGSFVVHKGCSNRAPQRGFVIGGMATTCFFFDPTPHTCLDSMIYPRAPKPFFDHVGSCIMHQN